MQSGRKRKRPTVVSVAIPFAPLHCEQSVPLHEQCRAFPFWPPEARTVPIPPCSFSWRELTRCKCACQCICSNVFYLTLNELLVAIIFFFGNFFWENNDYYFFSKTMIIDFFPLVPVPLFFFKYTAAPPFKTKTAPSSVTTPVVWKHCCMSKPETTSLIGTGNTTERPRGEHYFLFFQYVCPI